MEPTFVPAVGSVELAGRQPVGDVPLPQDENVSVTTWSEGIGNGALGFLIGPGGNTRILMKLSTTSFPLVHV